MSMVDYWIKLQSNGTPLTVDRKGEEDKKKTTCMRIATVWRRTIVQKRCRNNFLNTYLYKLFNNCRYHSHSCLYRGADDWGENA